MQQAVDAGYVLTDDAQCIWTTFENVHNKAGFSGAMDIPMESFTRAVEIVLKDTTINNAPTYRLPAELWEQAVRNSGYTQIRIATSRLKLALREA